MKSKRKSKESSKELTAEDVMAQHEDEFETLSDEEFIGYYSQALQDEVGDEFIGTKQVDSFVTNTASTLTQVQPGTGLQPQLLTDQDPQTHATKHTEPGLSWNDRRFRGTRLKIYYDFFTSYLEMAFFFLLVLSLLWGSMYNKGSYFANLTFLVAIDDNSSDNYIGQAVVATVESGPMRAIGTWEVLNHAELVSISASNNRTVEEEIIDLLYQQHYWGVVYVRENATNALIDSLIANKSDMETPIIFMYETGRDYLAMTNFIYNNIISFADAYLSNLPPFYTDLLNSLPNNTTLQLLSDNPTLLTSMPFVRFQDNTLPPSPILQAAFSNGLVYLIIFTFFSFLAAGNVHLYIATKVKGTRYIVYRMLASHTSYLVVSLAWVILNTGFQMTFTRTFGKAGFLVEWMITFLLMASLGAANEVILLILFTYNPAMVGFWLLILVVSNVAPVASSIALSNVFYRYGYALPLRNAYEAFNVIFFDTYKGKLGRNIGVMCAWMVVGNVILPFVINHVTNTRNARAASITKMLANKARQASTKEIATADATEGTTEISTKS